MKIHDVKVEFHVKNSGLELFSGIIYRGKDAAPTGSAGFRFKYIICVVVQRSDELLRADGLRFLQEHHDSFLTVTVKGGLVGQSRPISVRQFLEWSQHAFFKKTIIAFLVEDDVIQQRNTYHRAR